MPKENAGILRTLLILQKVCTRFFSGLVSPLLELTKKKVRFHWSEVQKITFERLKEKLTTAPVLGLPSDKENMYWIQTTQQ